MKKHHSDKNYIFWPDLARALYSKEAVSSINKYVTYVPTHLNTTKVPQARLIESFLGYLAQKVYERGWEVTTVEELIRGINEKSHPRKKILIQITWKPLFQVSRQK